MKSSMKWTQRLPSGVESLLFIPLPAFLRCHHPVAVVAVLPLLLCLGVGVCGSHLAIIFYANGQTFCAFIAGFWATVFLFFVSSHAPQIFSERLLLLLRCCSLYARVCIIVSRLPTCSPSTGGSPPFSQHPLYGRFSFVLSAIFFLLFHSCRTLFAVRLK